MITATGERIITPFNAGKKLYELRSRARLSPPQLAKKVGIHQTTILNTELGLTKPTSGTIWKLNKYFATASLG